MKRLLGKVTLIFSNTWKEAPIGNASIKPAATGQKEVISESAKRIERIAWIFLAPTIIIVFSVAAYPLFNTIYATFFDGRLGSSREWAFVGLSNYTTLLFSPQMVGSSF